VGREPSLGNESGTSTAKARFHFAMERVSGVTSASDKAGIGGDVQARVGRANKMNSIAKDYNNHTLSLHCCSSTSHNVPTTV
jgi:hypothetical protein